MSGLSSAVHPCESAMERPETDGHGSLRPWPTGVAPLAR